MIDTATNMVVATVPMGDDPRGVAVTPDGKETCHLSDPGDTGRPWLEDARRVWPAVSTARFGFIAVTRLAGAARPVRFGDAYPSWQRRISTDFAPSPGKYAIRGRRYREELPER